MSRVDQEKAYPATCLTCGNDAVIVTDLEDNFLEAYHPAVTVVAMRPQVCRALIPLGCECGCLSHRIPQDQAVRTPEKEQQ